MKKPQLRRPDLSRLRRLGSLRRTAVIVPVAVAAVALGGGAVAYAVTSGDEQLSGTTLEQAGAAAVAAAGGGTVTEAEATDDLGVAYEVEVTMTDGSRVEVDLDADFGVVSVVEGRDGDRHDRGSNRDGDRDGDRDRDGRRDSDGDMDSDDVPLTSAEATAAGDAALAEIGPGTVTEVERGDADDTEAWEVEVVTDAGEEWHVELDADLAVIGSHLDD